MNKKYFKKSYWPQTFEWQCTYTSTNLDNEYREYQEYHTNNPKYEKLYQEKRNNKQLFTVICWLRKVWNAWEEVLRVLARYEIKAALSSYSSVDQINKRRCATPTVRPMHIDTCSFNQVENNTA